MRYFHIPSPKLLNKIFLCAVYISIRQLIDYLVIPNQLHADNFTPVTRPKVVCNIFIEIETS